MLDANSTANGCREVSPKRVTDTSRPIGTIEQIPGAAHGVPTTECASLVTRVTGYGLHQMKPGLFGGTAP